jgi:hypothetical protein
MKCRVYAIQLYILLIYYTLFMKKFNLFLSLSTVLVFNGVFAQENVISEEGNIGLGTGSTIPTERLQVAGRVRIDSTLVVSDSVNMASSARVGADLKVEGNLILPNIPLLHTLDDQTVLLTEASGRTVKSSITQLLDLMYKRECADVNGGIVASPTWANGPNKLFSACPEVKVGIGTNAPTHSLTVFGGSKINGEQWITASLSVGADINTGAKVYVKNSSANAAIHINNIGNAINYQKLLFFEYDRPNTEIIKVQNTASNYSAFLLNANGEMNINNGTGRTFHLGTDGALELTNGTTQTFKVETTGMIRGRRMKLDLNTWADYVFEPTYQLMPLSEVETFVKKEKHLPNVPSEQELKTTGADVMELNKILMEKIEELTLYLIQQNKDTEELKSQLDELQTKLKELENRQ